MAEEQSHTLSESHKENLPPPEGFLAHLTPFSKKYKSLYSKKTRFAQKFADRDRFVRPHRVVANSLKRRAEKVYEYLPIRSRYKSSSILKSSFLKNTPTPSWQSLDMVLPVQTAGQAAPQASMSRPSAIPSTRELAPGVIIPRKENDSLFKATKPGTPVKKPATKPIIPPTHRMYSRVEEGPKKKDGEPTSSYEPPSPSEPSMVQREIEEHKSEKPAPRFHEQEREEKQHQVEPQEATLPPVLPPAVKESKPERQLPPVRKVEKKGGEPPVVRTSRPYKPLVTLPKPALERPVKSQSVQAIPQSLASVKKSVSPVVQREPESTSMKETSGGVEPPRVENEELLKKDDAPQVKQDNSQKKEDTPLVQKATEVEKTVKPVMFKRPEMSVKKEIPLAKIKRDPFRPSAQMRTSAKPMERPGMPVIREKMFTPVVQREGEVETPVKAEITPPIERRLIEPKERHLRKEQPRPETSRPKQSRLMAMVSKKTTRPVRISRKPLVEPVLSMNLRPRLRPAPQVVMREELSVPEKETQPPVQKKRPALVPAIPKPDKMVRPTRIVQKPDGVKRVHQMMQMPGEVTLPVRKLPRQPFPQPAALPEVTHSKKATPPQQSRTRKFTPAAPGVVQRLKQRYRKPSGRKGVTTGDSSTPLPGIPLPVRQTGEVKETMRPVVENQRPFSSPQEPAQKKGQETEKSMPVVQVNRTSIEPAIVQREINIGGGEPPQQDGSEQSPDSQESVQQEQPKVNLDEIARQVYPLLMHRIALEKERSSGWLKR